METVVDITFSIVIMTSSIVIMIMPLLVLINKKNVFEKYLRKRLQYNINYAATRYLKIINSYISLTVLELVF